MEYKINQSIVLVLELIIFPRVIAPFCVFYSKEKGYGCLRSLSLIFHYVMAVSSMLDYIADPLKIIVDFVGGIIAFICDGAVMVVW